MPATCITCGHTTQRYTSKLTARGEWIYECRVCTHPPVLSGAVTPFSELQLDHVHDEFGQPVRVTSLRQLREAEKRYHFRSCIANTDEENFDKPPKQEQKHLAHHVKWLEPEIGPQIWADIQAGRIQ